jgi:hypothetical protein
MEEASKRGYTWVFFDRDLETEFAPNVDDLKSRRE